MSMVIQLDTAAVESLFPEGSEARVQLTNSVIANISSKFFEKHVPVDVIQKSVLKQYAAHYRKEVDALIQSEFNVGEVINDGESTTIINAIRERIKSEMDTLAEIEVVDMLDGLLETRFKRFEERLRSYITSYYVNTQQDKLIDITKQLAVDHVEEVTNMVAKHVQSSTADIKEALANEPAE